MSADALISALIVVGFIAQVVTWRLIVAGRVSVWVGMGVTMGVLGVLSLLSGRIHLSPKVGLVAAGAVGLASGLGLFVATRIFVRIAAGWETFRRHTMAIYGNRSSVPLPVAVVIAAGLSAPGEELFWRGLAGGRLASAGGSLAAGAAIALCGYVVACAASANIAVIAGAVVGGGLWSILFVWTGGVLAAICSHVVFTGLMVVLPPAVARAEQPQGAA